MVLLSPDPTVTQSGVPWCPGGSQTSRGLSCRRARRAGRATWAHWPPCAAALLPGDRGQREGGPGVSTVQGLGLVPTPDFPAQLSYGRILPHALLCSCRCRVTMGRMSVAGPEISCWCTLLRQTGKVRQRPVRRPLSQLPRHPLAPWPYPPRPSLPALSRSERRPGCSRVTVRRAHPGGQSRARCFPALSGRVLHW